MAANQSTVECQCDCGTGCRVIVPGWIRCSCTQCNRGQGCRASSVRSRCEHRVNPDDDPRAARVKVRIYPMAVSGKPDMHNMYYNVLLDHDASVGQVVARLKPLLPVGHQEDVNTYRMVLLGTKEEATFQLQDCYRKLMLCHPVRGMAKSGDSIAFQLIRPGQPMRLPPSSLSTLLQRFN